MKRGHVADTIDNIVDDLLALRRLILISPENKEKEQVMMSMCLHNIKYLEYLIIKENGDK